MPETHTAVDLRSATPTRQLVIERTFKASPERVFDAFTDPAQIQAWWWPHGFTCPTAEVDLRVGGTYRIAMEWPGSTPAEAQFSHHMRGEYYEIDRPHRLVMSGRPVDDEDGELFATSRCLPPRPWAVPSRAGPSSSTSSSGFSRTDRKSVAPERR